MTRLTVEIALPLDGAIILAGRIFELYPDPVASLKRGRADKADCRYSAVIQFDSLAERERAGIHCDSRNHRQASGGARIV